MITIENEIRTHLISKGIVSSNTCKLNFPDSSSEQVCIRNYGGWQVATGQKPTIQITVFSGSQDTAKAKIGAIYDELISDTPKKIKEINGRNMFVEANQQPFFLERDESKRFVFTFNITVTAFR